MLAWLSQVTAFGKGGSLLAPQQVKLFLDIAVGPVEGTGCGQDAQCHPQAFLVLVAPGDQDQAAPGALHPCAAMHCRLWLCFRVPHWGELEKGKKCCWEGERDLETVCFGTKEVERIESNVLRSCQILKYVEWLSVRKSCFILSGISHSLVAGLFVWHPEQPIHYLIDCRVSQCSSPVQQRWHRPWKGTPF